MQIKETPSLSVKDIAEEMSVTDATVRVWINSGKLAAFKLPGSGSQLIYRIKREDFDEFLQLHRTRQGVA
jgi:excisionase family DNA binding protein